MTEPEVPEEVLRLSERIRHAHGNLLPVTADTVYGPPGTEPVVVIYVGGVQIADLRRDDFLDYGVYEATCLVIEAEQRRERAN